MRHIIYPYKPHSHSARILARAIEGKCIYYGKGYRYQPTDIIVNWGNTNLCPWGVTTYNRPERVRIAVNKLETFKAFKQHVIPHPEWTTDENLANHWLSDGLLVSRSSLNSSGGRGISLVSEISGWVSGKLYVKYIPKRSEYRIHVFRGKVIDVQEKRRKQGAKELETYSSQIRSHDRGWVFCRENINLPNGIKDLAINAVVSLGLDFGAVDIIYNQKQDRCYVLEVNTAPGIEGKTVVSYAEAIKNV